VVFGLGSGLMWKGWLLCRIRRNGRKERKRVITKKVFKNKKKIVLKPT
jgi:hypothetical protein